MSRFLGIGDQAECLGVKKEDSCQKKQEAHAAISKREDRAEEFEKALMIFYLLIPFPNKVNSIWSDMKAFNDSFDNRQLN